MLLKKADAALDELQVPKRKRPCNKQWTSD